MVKSYAVMSHMSSRGITRINPNLLSPPGLLVVEARAMLPCIAVPCWPIAIWKRQVVGLLLHEPHTHGILDGLVFVHSCSKILPILIIPGLPAWNVSGLALWMWGSGLVGVVVGILHK